MDGRSGAAYSLSKVKQLSHDDLLQLRKLYQDPQAQASLAPIEHEAYARQYAAESPLTGGASLSVAIPAYTLAKYLNLPIAQGARSAPSMEEIISGYRGLGGGLLQAGRKSLRGLLE